MSPRVASRSNLASVSLWQFITAKRYHVTTLRALARLTGFVTCIVATIWLSDYTRAHPLAITIGGLGFARFADRGIEVVCDVVCDRVFPAGT